MDKLIKNKGYQMQARTSKPQKPILRVTKLLSVLALGGIVLTGCAVERINTSMQEGQTDMSHAQRMMDEAKSIKAFSNRDSVLNELTEFWVDTTPQEMNNQSLGGKVTALDCNITFNPKTSVQLRDFARIVTDMCGVPVHISADAIAALNGGVLATGGLSSSSSTSSGDTLPNPNLSVSGDGMSASQIVGGSALSDTITGVNWSDDKLSGLLDLVVGRLGLGWKYSDNQITISYFDTETFPLYALSGKSEQKTSVKSGGSSSSSSVGTQAGNFTSDGSSQETTFNYESDIVKDITTSIEAMLTPGLGRLSVSTSTGSVTVTDRPQVLKRVKAYVKKENHRLTRQVLLKVNLYSINLNQSDSVGLNWDAVYSNLTDYTIGFNSSFPMASGASQAIANVINPENRWNDSKAIFSALSTQGHVTMKAAPMVPTLNMASVPLLLGRQISYLAKVSTTTLSGSDSVSEDLEPGVLNTGLNMVMRPMIMDNQEILLRFDLTLSSLNELKEVSSREAKIQLPDLDTRIFSQSVKIKSGSTLLLSGFDQMNLDADKGGTGDPNFWLLGGGGSQNRAHTALVVAITPVILD